ncbi:hypothetical protein F5Y15DRAFT_388504 [Xylariaceae sp. FL0016]|nr:hypothetical protein F5Y15DRAFT_388504 [Xylariaceae sp. FL0016]
MTMQLTKIASGRYVLTVVEDTSHTSPPFDQTFRHIFPETKYVDLCAPPLRCQGSLSPPETGAEAGFRAEEVSRNGVQVRGGRGSSTPKNSLDQKTDLLSGGLGSEDGMTFLKTDTGSSNGKDAGDEIVSGAPDEGVGGSGSPAQSTKPKPSQPQSGGSRKNTHGGPTDGSEYEIYGLGQGSPRPKPRPRPRQLSGGGPRKDEERVANGTQQMVFSVYSEHDPYNDEGPDLGYGPGVSVGSGSELRPRADSGLGSGSTTGPGSALGNTGGDGRNTASEWCGSIYIWHADFLDASIPRGGSLCSGSSGLSQFGPGAREVIKDLKTRVSLLEYRTDLHWRTQDMFSRAGVDPNVVFRVDEALNRVYRLQDAVRNLEVMVYRQAPW